jgi:hypothetical protein
LHHESVDEADSAEPDADHKDKPEGDQDHPPHKAADFGKRLRSSLALPILALSPLLQTGRA